MPQTDGDRITPAILAAGCLVAASICLAARYVVPALMLSGMNFADTATRDNAFASHLGLANCLMLAAALLGIASLVLATWALIGRRPAP